MQLLASLFKEFQLWQRCSAPHESRMRHASVVVWIRLQLCHTSQQEFCLSTLAAVCARRLRGSYSGAEEVVWSVYSRVQAPRRRIKTSLRKLWQHPVINYNQELDDVSHSPWSNDFIVFCWLFRSCCNCGTNQDFMVAKNHMKWSVHRFLSIIVLKLSCESLKCRCISCGLPSFPVSLSNLATSRANMVRFNLNSHIMC